MLRMSWDNSAQRADLVMTDGGLATDEGLGTAVLLSLFSDAAAQQGDEVPASDRRGWWGDRFSTAAEDVWGSRLWTLDRAVPSQEALRRTEDFARESLAWLVEDGVAERIEAIAAREGERRFVRVEVWRPADLAPSWSHVWEVHSNAI